MIKKLTYYLLGYLLFFSGCNKEGVGCFNDGGKITSVIIDVPDFSSIDVATNIEIEILSEGDDLVELITGENLVPGISMKVEEGVLLIENLNTCFFARDYTSPHIKIRNAGLERIVQHGYGRVFSSDTLRLGNLSIQVEDASGAVDLLVDANSIKIVSNNIGPITLKGKSNRLTLGQYWSDGVFVGKDLLVKDCSINHNGANRMDVNVVNKLSGSINSIGNVYLYGQRPAIIDVDLTNRGEIIEKF